MSENVQTAQAPKKAGAVSETIEAVKTIVVALLIALVLKTVLFQPFTIPSASMEPNLYEGDYVIVSKYAYGWSRHSIPFSPPLFAGRLMEKAPKRGDIVVFKLPRDGRTDYIKRVIGLPGDTIQVTGGRVTLNGKPLPSRHVANVSDEQALGYFSDVERRRETLPGGPTYLTNDFGTGQRLDDTEVFEVPAGHYFMMGDNRDNSEDSRLPSEVGVGYVPAENLVGKAEIVLVSWERGASILKPWTWVKLRPGRFFKVLD